MRHGREGRMRPSLGAAHVRLRRAAHAPPGPSAHVPRGTARTSEVKLRRAGDGTLARYRPAGWRSTKPPPSLEGAPQRVPSSASATVSKRLPSMTMYACSAFA